VPWLLSSRYDELLVTANKVPEPNQVPKCGGGQQHVNPLPTSIALCLSFCWVGVNAVLAAVHSAC